MNATNEERDVIQHCFDPFPEPQTIPAGWDTSTLLPVPVTASAQQDQDSTDNESN